MGSAILEVKGIRKAGDLDIMLKPELFEQIKQNPSWKYTHKTGKLGDTIDLLEKDGVQLYFHVYGVEDFDYFHADPIRTELIDGMYFVSLQNLLEIKSGRWDREKDREDAELIKKYLNSI